MSKPFIGYESWVALDSERPLTDKERNRMSMPWRLWEIAISRVNNHGHAAFRKNELVRMACGHVSRSDAQAVYRGLRILADMGRIAPVSENCTTLLCILVNTDVARRDAGKGGYKFLCSEPSHMDTRQTPYSRTTLAPEFEAPPADDDSDAWSASWSDENGS